MRDIAVRILLTLLTLLSTSLATAQTFDNVSIAEASSVCSIAQDEQGMLWFGTENGLYSYDGYRTIPHNTNADKAAVNTRVHSILMRHNILYMATERGLLVYDIRKGCYNQLPKTVGGDIRAVAIYADRLWFGGAQGLFSHNMQTGETRSESSSLHNIYSLLATKHGLLVGTISGLTLFNNGKLKPIRIGEGRQPLVNALLSDGNNVWIGTEGALYHYDWQRFVSASPLTGNSIKSLSLYGNNIYAGTDNGLYIYNKVEKEATHALHDSRSPNSIANNIVWAVFTDRWGNLWAGTDQGVSSIRRHKFFTNTPLSNITQTGEGNCLHFIYRSPDGMMWLGGTNGLIGYNAHHGFMPDEKGYLAWFRQTSTNHYMSHNRVRRVYADREGNVIVCTDHGLNIYNPQTRQMRNIIVNDPSRRYSTAWAYDIVDDGMGRYWICSYMGGVFVISKEKLLHATTPTVVADRHLLNELQGLHVWQLVVDGRGNVWARMYDRGLDRINPHTMRVEHIVGKDRLINDICTDNKGNVWAAMNGEIKCFGMDKANDRSMKIAGFNDNETAMLCRVEDYIWAIIGQDCCIISAKGVSSRFALPGFRPLTMFYDRVSGYVLLGGNDAVASVPTSKLAAHSYSKPRCNLFLSGILVDNKPYVPEQGAATYLSEITLTHRQNNITFMLTDLPMAGLQPNVYAYRLEGVDHTWQYLHGERKEISYSALPSGTYTLEVRVMNAQGEAKDNIFAYSVTILPPWYLSVWAKIIYLLVLIGLVVWAMKFVMMRRRLREEREAKERIMQESSARSAFFYNLSRQLKQPLGSLFASVLTMLHDEKNANNAQRMEQMRRDVVDINTLVYKALDMQKGKDETEKLRKSTVDIVDFCRRTVDDARSRLGKKTDIGFHTDTPSAFANIDIVRTQPVLAELIDLAVELKTGDNDVNIGVENNGNKAVVTVDIPGISIPEEDMPFVFNRYYSMVKADGQPSVDINTLATLHELAQMHDAEAKVENQEGMVRVAFCVQLLQSAETTTAIMRDKHHSDDTRQTIVPSANADADARLLAKITDTVEAHIADSDFNVTRLQETLGLGSKLLYRKVKQMTGKTPVEFMRHIRMQRAAMLLKEGRFSVSEVMYMVGFSNSSYFSKCFQKVYGLTPTDYSRKS